MKQGIIVALYAVMFFALMKLAGVLGLLLFGAIFWAISKIMENK